MIYTEQTKKAMKLCFEAHKNQVDKSNLPYVFHPFHVADQMPDEITTVVGLLHDVVEDTNFTLNDISSMGFDPKVVEALGYLTHNESIDYFDYIRNIANNSIATTVKLADLEHNMDLNRIDNITNDDLLRVEKYQKCYDYLKNMQIKNNKIMES